MKAERSSAEAAVTAAQAQAQARLAIQQREDVAKERDAARRLASAAEKAETERIRERRAAAERVEQERKARLEAKIISVPSESKEFLYNKLAEVVNFSEEQARFASERYNDPSYIWSFLESKNYDGQHDAPIVLLSAAWPHAAADEAARSIEAAARGAHSRALAARHPFHHRQGHGQGHVAPDADHLRAARRDAAGPAGDTPGSGG